MAGFVYLIGTSTFQWYKIGKSKTPDVRVQNIGVLLPFKISAIGVWRAQNHSLLESALHEKYAGQRINGEWFRFSKVEAEALFNSLPLEARVYPSGASSDSNFAGFSNLDRDCPDDSKVRYKIKKMHGDFTPDEREARKVECIRAKEKRRQNQILLDMYVDQRMFD